MYLNVYVVCNSVYGDRHSNLSKCRIEGELKMVFIIVYELFGYFDFYNEYL